MSDAQQLLQQREKHIQDAIALKKPDQVPMASMWDFFPAKWKGVTVKEVMYDFQLMFDLWVECLQHFCPDLGDNPYPLRGVWPANGNIGFSAPRMGGHGVGENMTYQFVELEVMKADEYRPFPFRSLRFHGSTILATSQQSICAF